MIPLLHHGPVKIITLDEEEEVVKIITLEEEVVFKAKLQQGDNLLDSYGGLWRE